MPEEYSQDQYIIDMATRLRDLEQKHTLLKERTLLIGENLVGEREETFNQLQELKKSVIKLQQESERASAFLKELSEYTANLARKEELLMLQRQLDIIHPKK